MIPNTEADFLGFLRGDQAPPLQWSANALLLNGSAYGTRTRAPALRGPCPNRLDERAKRERPIYRSDAQTQGQGSLTTARTKIWTVSPSPTLLMRGRSRSSREATQISV